ncbi:hypothetical protein [Burkholderia cenocepacia]|uniref:hypothetical protein n=1 Tax=Burkholderia cenocepacia TaxID=95486 RepID=UPI00265AF11F|nr:hypothetical protein [Burkholderia cenocepacia]
MTSPRRRQDEGIFSTWMPPMHGKSLFLHRAVSRTDQWGAQFPALSMACRQPDSFSGGRQLAVAVTDTRGLRCAVFTSFGAILEFRASWDELERAGTWWHYAREWHFWVVDDLQSARRVFPTDSGQIVVASSESSDTSSTSTDSLLSLIRVAELRASPD